MDELKIKLIRFTWTASVFVIFEYSFVEEISLNDSHFSSHATHAYA